MSRDFPARLVDAEDHLIDECRRLLLYRHETEVILAAYGWEDVGLRHDFYTGRDAGNGVAEHDSRFTVHPDARNEILRRLLALNHERAGEERELIERGQRVRSAFSWLER